MNKFSENLKRLMSQANLSDRDIQTELLEYGVHIETRKISSWFKGVVPENLILRVLARIFTDRLEREITISEILGEIELKLREEPDGRVVAEIWKGDKYLGCIRPGPNGIRILSKYFENRQTVSNQIKFNAAQKPPEIFIVF